VTDFGLAKAFQEIQLKENIISSGESSRLSVFQTKQGKKVCGTLPYMAPEQFDGYADKRSDIYSFGITLYRMVMNGQLPFVGKGKTDEEIQQDYERQHKYEKIELPPHPLSSVIDICLRKEPASRYQSFQEVKEELQKLLLEETGEQVALPEITKLSIGDLINRGIALDSLYRYEEAIAYYDKAIMNEPGNVQAWNNKGYSLVNLALAAQKDSGNWDSWNNTEWLSINLGRFEEAIACYNEAIKINPQYEKAYANKGYVLVCLSKLKEAINCCDAAIKINPTHDWPWYLKGEALAKLHKFKEAIACFQQVLKINPRYCEAWLNMGCIAFGFKAYKEALVCTEKAIKLNPDFAQAHQLKQSILQELGK
jgi:tetratricopeptide (TPR) repeat protein